MTMGIRRLIASPKTFVKRKLAWHAWNIKTYRWGSKVALADSFRMNMDHFRGVLVLGIIATVVVLGAQALFGAASPYGFFEFWGWKGSLTDVIGTATWEARWVLMWGAGVTALISFLSRNKPSENRAAEEKYVEGIIISIFAGVSEEIVYRWLHFMFSIVLITVLNFVFFGFLGFGVFEWLQIHLIGPIANFFTLGLLKDQLTNPALWAVGAGMIAANGSFRDGHKYLGLLGYVNSWFIGMFFFYLVFTHGLIAAIFVHFLYDFLIFTVRYIDQVIERAQGNA